MNPQNPLMSVLINNYNYGRFLAAAIDSVLNQTYPHLEIIVVDDGSTDDSRAVMEAYGDRILAIFQPNAGQGAALNTGIRHASGDFVCLLDADDYFHPDKVAKVVDQFRQHPDWVQVSHPWTVVDANSNLKQTAVKTLSQGDVRSLLLHWGKYRSALTSALAYRREVLEQVLPIPSGQDVFADAYLMATVPFYGAVGSIDESLMFYRQHGKNIHAHTQDDLRLSYHIHGREVIAAYINQTAAKLHLPDRLDLQRDADYRLFSAMQTGNKSDRWQALQIIWLTVQEKMAIQCSPQEIVTRFVWVSLCLFFPSQSVPILKLGLKTYLRRKLLGQPMAHAPQTVSGDS
jgi:glycosyltransferase involved in cell wall biosynthesis